MLVERGSGSVVAVAEAAPFEWERLHVFPPYTPAEQADAELGVRCEAARVSGIFERDDITLLVFVSGKRVVRYVAHPRVQGDFAELHRQGGYSRAEAVFVVNSRSGMPKLEWPRGSRTRG